MGGFYGDAEAGKGQVRNKIQGADTKGKGKHHSANGACSKGSDFPRDHGKGSSSAPTKSSKGSGKGKNKGKGGDSAKGGGSAADDLMTWLKAGREGEAFEFAWKKWCKDHELSNVPKSQRIESIGEFKEAWESGTLS